MQGTEEGSMGANTKGSEAIKGGNVKVTNGLLWGPRRGISFVEMVEA